MDNWHTIIEACAAGDSLEIRFDNGETLTVLRPTRCELDERTFRIYDAAKLRWEWNAYGDPPGKRHFIEYVRVGDKVEATTDADWRASGTQPSGAELAVELL